MESYRSSHHRDDLLCCLAIKPTQSVFLVIFIVLYYLCYGFCSLWIFSERYFRYRNRPAGRKAKQCFQIKQDLHAVHWWRPIFNRINTLDLAAKLIINNRIACSVDLMSDFLLIPALSIKRTWITRIDLRHSLRAYTPCFYCS